MKTENRKIYPLPIEKISNLSSFEQIFGRTISEYSEDERMERWDRAMGGDAIRGHYESVEGCKGCMHNQSGWCAFVSLPCGVNPILTFQYGVVGMACMGVGYEPVPGTQLEIEFESSGLPF